MSLLDLEHLYWRTGRHIDADRLRSKAVDIARRAAIEGEWEPGYHLYVGVRRFRLLELGRLADPGSRSDERLGPAAAYRAGQFDEGGIGRNSLRADSSEHEQGHDDELGFHLSVLRLVPLRTTSAPDAIAAA